MKKLFFIAAVLSASALFPACSDKHDNKISPAQLVGTWQITLDEGWEIFAEDGSREEWSTSYPDASEGNYYWTLTFKENGVCIYESHSDTHSPDIDYTAEYTYTVSGNTLTTQRKKEESDLDFSGTIKKLSSDQLVLFRSGSDADGQFEQTETYKKVE